MAYPWRGADPLHDSKRSYTFYVNTFFTCRNGVGPRSNSKGQVGMSIFKPPSLSMRYRSWLATKIAERYTSFGCWPAFQ
jgi:hypothetical protein